MNKEMIRFAFQLSPLLADKLEKMAQKNCVTKTDVLRKSLMLLWLVTEYKETGYKLTFVDKEGSAIDVVGF